MAVVRRSGGCRRGIAGSGSEHPHTHTHRWVQAWNSRLGSEHSKWRLLLKPAPGGKSNLLWEPPLGWNFAPQNKRNWAPESKRNTVDSLPMYLTEV